MLVKQSTLQSNIYEIVNVIILDNLQNISSLYLGGAYDWPHPQPLDTSHEKYKPIKQVLKC